MFNDNALLIPGYQRLCHSILRTPVIGPSWLILGILAIIGDTTFTVRFILALAISIAALFTAWPTIVLTPFAMLASLFFIGNMGDNYATFYVIYMVAGAVVYSVYLLVTVRIGTGKYVVSRVTGQIMYDSLSFIKGDI